MVEKLEKCPACGVVVEVVTFNHMKSVHGAKDKASFFAQHGQIEEISTHVSSKVQRWARESRNFPQPEIFGSRKKKPVNYVYADSK